MPVVELNVPALQPGVKHGDGQLVLNVNPIPYVHRVPDELRRHLLSDGVGGRYSTNLNRNR